MKASVFYLVPDNKVPSWGLGIIYHHVLILKQAGYNAYIIHQESYFKVDWLKVKVPILYWNQAPIIKEHDVLVVPEVMVDLQELKNLPCRKILFVQATSFLFNTLPENETHKSLGFESAIGIMPHMISIIEKFTGLSINLVPPFVADYFYKSYKELNRREKNILIFPKFQQQDFGIVRRLVADKLRDFNRDNTNASTPNWRLIELKGKTHKQVAEMMQKATFFIATNTFESFNASVVEAMAAGCIPICYEGFGSRDYLKNNKNAIVFGNNEAYEMCRKIHELLDSFEENKLFLEHIREQGQRTAKNYSLDATKVELLRLFES